MTEIAKRPVRPRDAASAREAILSAAEAVFAEHGFDGARVDAIAEAAHYNKSLIFQYFGDKLGLYAEVLKRTDRELNLLLMQLFAPLLEDQTLVSDAPKLRLFLKATFGALFDYMVDHPRFTRMINWEQAEGWQAFARIASQFEPSDLQQLEALFSQAQQTGLIRPDLDVVVVILLAIQLCWSFPNAFPLYQTLLSGKDLAASNARAHAREQIVSFLVAGVMNDPAVS